MILFRCKGSDCPESWFADRDDLEAAIRENQPQASEEELAAWIAEIEDFEPGADDLAAWKRFNS